VAARLRQAESNRESENVFREQLRVAAGFAV
jgi:hypothetical protein